ncbi:MAG: hypothetical protein ABIG44_05930 [Planctomycetota bacterium]
MSTAFVPSSEFRRGALFRSGSAVLILAAAWMATAAPPIDPLPAPQYSFDLQSPKVQGGLVAARDVLAYGFPDPEPLVDGPLLGLDMPGDDLDALSGGNPYLAPGDEFVLLFSVDRETIGVEPPLPQLVEMGYKYNVYDQAIRVHAAGDQFMSTNMFSWFGRGRGSGIGNNSLSRNNYDEGGTSFSGDPPLNASQTNRAPQDNVDATALLFGTILNRPMIGVYFSVTAESPSLYTLPGNDSPSGANIFYNEDPMSGLPTELYAYHFALGLVPPDDIDALIVFDTNMDGMFNYTDQVLFSLTPDSPSLLFIPGASPEGAAADVFVVRPGEPPMLFAAALELGLGEYWDNLDALEFLLCDDALFCIIEHCIYLLLGDWTHDGHIDLADYVELPHCLLGPDHDLLASDCDAFDFEYDYDVDLADFAQFQQVFKTK